MVTDSTLTSQTRVLQANQEPIVSNIEKKNMFFKYNLFLVNFERIVGQTKIILRDNQFLENSTAIITALLAINSGSLL